MNIRKRHTEPASGKERIYIDEMSDDEKNEQ